MSLQIETLPAATLTPYARNARTHSPEQVRQIAASISEFGFTNPVLIDGEGGIVAGHGRVMAAQSLGLDQVPCLRLNHLTEAQKRAYILADNQLALNAGWDESLLSLELTELQELDVDLGLIGFDAGELERLLELANPLTPDDGSADDVPDLQPNAISQPGDVWVLGRHRLMCGDSTDAESVRRLMSGQIADLLHADPPYGMGKEKDGVANDNLYRDKLDAFQMSWWKTFRPHLADNASAYVWGNAPDLWRLWYRGGLADSERLTLRNEITWDKKAAGAGGISHMGAEGFRQYPNATERCLFFMLGEQGFNNNADNYWEGWEPIRAYLEGEMKKAGWTVKDINRITGTQMGGHWVTKSQWMLPTQAHYEKLQASSGKEEAFRRDYDALRRDFYATRAHFDNTHDTMTDVWEFSRVTGEERHGHATPKPVAMMARVMRSSLPRDGLACEPFSGSGSTIMAAEQTARRCYAMELSPQYVDVAVRRWQQFTGQRATLETTGQLFPD